MTHHPSTNILNNIDKYQSLAPKSVVNALKQASDKTGVDFSYLMEQAATESSFNAKAKARSSSATGLFQFIDSTWLSMVKEHGGKYGLQEFSDKISVNKKGRASVSDSAAHKEILEMRKDPKLSAFMAAEFALKNKQHLEKTLGRKANATDMYMAHLLGPNGATKFLKTLDTTPAKGADDVLPRAARANKNLFYEQANTSKARSVKDIYAHFVQKFGDKVHDVSPPKAGEDRIVVAEANITAPPMPTAPEKQEGETVMQQPDMPNRPYYGRIAPTATTTAQRLSAEAIFAMADMTSVLYELTSDQTENTGRIWQADDKKDKGQNDGDIYANFPTPDFNDFFV